MGPRLPPVEPIHQRSGNLQYRPVSHPLSRSWPPGQESGGSPYSSTVNTICPHLTRCTGVSLQTLFRRRRWDDDPFRSNESHRRRHMYTNPLCVKEVRTGTLVVSERHCRRHPSSQTSTPCTFTYRRNKDPYNPSVSYRTWTYNRRWSTVGTVRNRRPLLTVILWSLHHYVHGNLEGPSYHPRSESYTTERHRRIPNPRLPHWVELERDLVTEVNQRNVEGYNQNPGWSRIPERTQILTYSSTTLGPDNPQWVNGKRRWPLGRRGPRVGYDRFVRRSEGEGKNKTNTGQWIDNLRLQESIY